MKVKCNSLSVKLKLFILNPSFKATLVHTEVVVDFVLTTATEFVLS